jgi:hypothetical protein
VLGQEDLQTRKWTEVGPTYRFEEAHMSMHPHSSALLREMELASEAERQRAMQHRYLQLGDEAPSSQTLPARGKIAAALARLGDHWRNRSPRVGQTVEPSGS